MRLFALDDIKSGCTNSDVKTPSSKSEVTQNNTTSTSTAVKTEKEASAIEYVAMDGFSYDLGKFVGLTEGETFAESEAKINAVFKTYEGHAQPQNIDMDASIVEAGWKQVLVTQDGLMDGTVTGQQLLAVFDDEKKLISYGMRIKCHNDQGTSDWQIEVCE